MANWNMTLRRVDDEARGLALHDVAASRQAEKALMAGLPAHALIERAGLAVARLAMARFPAAKRVVALAGPGSNGGDALIAARWLHRWGREVDVLWHADPAALAGAQGLPDDAAHALAAAREAGVTIRTPHEVSILCAGTLWLDGLLGLGASRPADGLVAAGLDRLAGRGLADTVLAIDLPSGLDADRGVALGGRAVHADATLALLTLKPGLFTGAGRDHAGEVWFDALARPGDPQTVAIEPTAWLIGAPHTPDRPHASHKGRYGDVLVVGGAPGMAGAALLAGRAALAAGGGRVFVSRLDGHALASLDGAPELMPREPSRLVAEGLIAGSTVVAGCGGGAAIEALMPALLAEAPRLVLDADALNALARAGATAAAQVAARHARGQSTVLTPHPLEAARLLGVGAAEVQADRPKAALRLAHDFGSIVVLKGSGSVVAGPDGRWAICPRGNARLATAGSGDVLAGWLGGRWSAWLPANGFEAACAAVWEHGRAAEVAPGAPWPLTAGRLVDALTAG